MWPLQVLSGVSAANILLVEKTLAVWPLHVISGVSAASQVAPWLTIFHVTIYTLSNPIYTLSIPYLYPIYPLVTFFLIFCLPYLYPIYTLSILMLRFLNFS